MGMLADIFKSAAADAADALTWELPDAYGAKLWAEQESGIAKGRTHRYIRRTGSPGHYRYTYHAAHGGGVHDEKHLVVGSKLRTEGGHYEITHADGESLTVKHDESGETKTMTRKELAAHLREHHKAALEAHAKNKALPYKVRRLAPGSEARKKAEAEHAAAQKPPEPKPAPAATEGTKAAEKPTKPAPTHLSWGWNNEAIRDRQHPAEVGDIVKRKDEPHIVVTKTRSQYIREEGMSLGLGDDRGWLHTATVREATPEEITHYEQAREAPLREQATREAARQRVKDAAAAVTAAFGAAEGREEIAFAPAGVTRDVSLATYSGPAKYGLHTPQLTVHRDATHAYSHHYIYDWDLPTHKVPRTPKLDAAIDALAEATKAVDALPESAPYVPTRVQSPRAKEMQVEASKPPPPKVNSAKPGEQGTAERLAADRHAALVAEIAARPPEVKRPKAQSLVIGSDARPQPSDTGTPHVFAGSPWATSSKEKAYVARLTGDDREFLRPTTKYSKRSDRYDLDPGKYEARSQYQDDHGVKTRTVRFEVREDGSIVTEQAPAVAPSATEIPSASDGLKPEHHERAKALGLTLRESGKSVAIGGKGTFAHKDARIKPHGGRFDGATKTWTVPKENLHKVLKAFAASAELTKGAIMRTGLFATLLKGTNPATPKLTDAEQKVVMLSRIDSRIRWACMPGKLDYPGAPSTPTCTCADCCKSACKGGCGCGCCGDTDAEIADKAADDIIGDLSYNTALVTGVRALGGVEQLRGVILGRVAAMRAKMAAEGERKRGPLSSVLQMARAA